MFIPFLQSERHECHAQGPAWMAMPASDDASAEADIAIFTKV